MRKVSSAILFLMICFLVNAQSQLKPDGYNYIYHPNGVVQSEGLLKGGKPEGLWINYYPTGVKKSEGIWKNSQLDSVWVFFTIKGDTSSKITYQNGMKNGFSYEYYTNAVNPVYNGSIKEKALYINNKREGKTFTYYEDGRIDEEIDYVGNYKDGNGIKYSKEGRVVTIYNYRKGTITEREKINRFNKEGKKEGLWREYYDDFRIKSECYYKDGLLNGYYKEYARNGELTNTVLYKDNIVVHDLEKEDLQSNLKEDYYEDGSLKAKGSFRNNKPIGVHKYYSKDGNSIIARIYNDDSVLLEEGEVDSNGYRKGLWKLFYSDGKVWAKGEYKRNRREGNWEFYYKNGIEEQKGAYTKGQYAGTWNWFYEDGTLWKEEDFYNGKNEGKYIEYSQSGEILVEGNYYDGEREGSWITQINDNKAVGKYASGLMDGIWKHYYDDGQVSFEGSYIQGVPDGKHKYYHSNGNLKEEQYYNNGIKQKHWKKFDEDGHLVITITYKNDKEYRVNGVKIDLPDDIVPTVIE